MKHDELGTQTSAPALGLRITIGAAALVIFVALAIVAVQSGCGGDGAEQASNTTSSAPQASAPQGGGPVAALPAVATSTSAAAGGRVIALGDSLPPDVAVAVEDTLVRPGDVVEITAEGSDDVSQVGLSDGLGRLQLFRRDEGSNVWRVLYRVPIRTTKDRVALSVTALNDLNRWRRVWVFIDVQPSVPSAEPEIHDDDTSVVK
jgi:hypothetical protein